MYVRRRYDGLNLVSHFPSVFPAYLLCLSCHLRDANVIILLHWRLELACIRIGNRICTEILQVGKHGMNLYLSIILRTTTEELLQHDPPAKTA
jgi:hypothetical protein